MLNTTLGACHGSSTHPSLWDGRRERPSRKKQWGQYPMSEESGMEPTLLGISGIRMGQPSHVSSISSYPRHPGVPHPSLIALWDPHHSHGPPSTLLSGCAASVTHLGRLPLALCLTGFMVLQSTAQMLCALCSSPNPRCAWPHCFPVCCVHLGVGGSLRSPGLSPGSQPGPSPTPGPRQVLSKCCE